MEILRQCQEPPDAIYVAIGGGGLIGGIAAYVKSLWPNVEVIGVEPHDAAAMTLSLEAGERIRLPQVGLFADGVAVRRSGGEHLPLGPALCGFNRHGEHGRNLCSDQRRVRRHVPSLSRQVLLPLPASKPTCPDASCRANSWWPWPVAPT